MNYSYWHLLGPFLFLSGAGLIYGEISRLFKNTLAAVVENLLDWRTGHSLKIVFGAGLLYAGLFLLDLSAGQTIHFHEGFPFLLPGAGKRRFLEGYFTILSAWIVMSVVLSWVLLGVQVPIWIRLVRIWSVRLMLLIVAGFSAAHIVRNFGDDKTADGLAVVFWFVAICEIICGCALGFSAYVGSSSEAIDSGRWWGGVTTWTVLRLGERTVLYMFSVLLTLAFASLFAIGTSSAK